jgi:hypothetical protein
LIFSTLILLSQTSVAKLVLGNNLAKGPEIKNSEILQKSAKSCQAIEIRNQKPKIRKECKICLYSQVDT